MATIIFDLDDTLINTSSFKKDILPLMAHSLNLTTSEVEAEYKKSVENKKYEFEKKIVNWQNSQKINFAKYLMPKAEKLLQELGRNHRLILLTKGEDSLQNLKLENSGLSKYFHKNEIYIVENNKLAKLKEINCRGEVFFINDKTDENEEIQKAFPEFICFTSIEEFKNKQN